MKLRFFAYFLLFESILQYRSNTGYIDLEIEFNVFLNEVKTYLPVSLILNTIE